MSEPHNSRLGTVLERAEAELRQLIADELAAGRYGEVAAIAQAAEVLSDLARNGGSSTGRIQMSSRASDDGASENRPVFDAEVKQHPAGLIGATRTLTRYPRFYREGGRIVKVSWSKSTGSEYEHKAGKAVLDAVCEGLHRLAATKKHFSIEELGRIRLDSNGPVIPSYQLYLCIAWLRAEGLLDQNGRDGYTIPKKDAFRENVEAKWEMIHEVRASE